MTVCSFFLQGRCRYGEKCWNEHPRGGGRSGGYGSSGSRPSPQSGNSRGGGGRSGGYGSSGSRPSPQSGNSRGGGSFGNRVWVNPSQRSSGRDYVQSSSFSKGGGSDWGREGSAGGQDSKSSSFSFSAQNRFSSLSSQAYDGGGRGDDNDKHLEMIQKDVETWESSGQWPFSCYSILKAPISGFSELSAEELRLEYYNSRAADDLQNYAHSVQQLANQWRSRVQELKTMNSSTRAALIAELNNPSPQSMSMGFPSTTSSFGTGGFGAGRLDDSSSSSFSFSSGSAGFGSAGGFGSGGTQGLLGSGSAGPSQPLAPFGSSGSGFGSSAPPSAASFSFTEPAASKTPPSFAASASGFSFSAAGFGLPEAATPAAGGDSFGQPVRVLSGVGAATGGAPDKLFTPQSELTPDELKEFSGKRFTLGQIPLRPPPADLLVV
ncbi:nucleoporin NUP42 [Megalops cyprinoides]|uniref:nucleoporin NUP42 n=1 Tax=Megalops cyprinoides TaxID=118141 RepID=UPI0018642D87|nr:nucleoporin NUP42 [Megalops cyprinoides]